MSEKRPEFSSDYGAQDTPVLECPSCGFGFLHQCRVEVFSREEEDSKKGQHVSVDYADGVSVTPEVGSDDGNPSRRRDGIIVKFWCEDCRNKNNPYELVIQQHKGNEYIFWDLSESCK